MSKFISSLKTPDFKKSEKNEDAHLTQEFRDKMEALPNLTVKGATVRLFSWDEISGSRGRDGLANVIVNSGKKTETIGSVNDPRMGVIDSNARCSNCFKIDCEGHYGLIKFPRPICNPAFIKEIYHILRCVCHTCGRLLMTEQLMKQKGFLELSGEARLVAVKDYCKKSTECKRKQSEKWLGCPERRGPIIECGHNPEYISNFKKDDDQGQIFYTNGGGTKRVKEIQDVLDLFECIPLEDIILMGFPSTFHPRDLIMKGIVVMPTVARPHSIEDGVMYLDQTTTAYKEIATKIAKSKTDKTQDENLDTDLYTRIRMLFFKSEATGNNPGTLSITERMQGKTGFFRRLMMGKVVGSCGRGVASPDPSLEFGEAGVPESIAVKTTKPIKITSWNKAWVRSLAKQGKLTTYSHKGIRYPFDKKKEYTFAVGDVVERHLMDGDRITLNRQPTLHAPSMLGHKAKIHSDATIKAHLSITTPTNLDFDGDVGIPQSSEVDAEVQELMDVRSVLISRENNRPSMGLVLNSVVGAYMLCMQNVDITERMLVDLRQLIVNKEDLETIDERLEKYKVDRLSGKGLLSNLFPADFYYNQGSVVIIQGILISGMLTKSHLGTSHRSLVQELHKKYGKKRAGDFLTSAPWIINRWLMEYGLTVSLKDMTKFETDQTTGERYNVADRIAEREYTKIKIKVSALGGKRDNQEEEDQRQQELTASLTSSNAIGAQVMDEILGPTNNIRVMGEGGSGTKGTLSQISQMMAMVGQQEVGGRRVQPSMANNTRTLPCYPEGDESPEACGFVPHSLIHGVDIVGLFNMCLQGRQALIQSGLGASETGDEQRKQTKTLENICTDYDGSVRNIIKNIFSSSFNCGYSISESVQVEEIPRFIDLRTVIRDFNSSQGWVHNSIAPKQLIGAPKRGSSKVKQLKAIEPVFLNYDSRITKFERARIISARSIQLYEGDEPKVEIEEEDLMDPVRIATREFDLGLLDIYVIRKNPLAEITTVLPTLENIQ
jgi:DNA-directed RNA polymerase beta' subunit/DNA-directed RNA polymerase subunit K/omega